MDVPFAWRTSKQRYKIFNGDTFVTFQRTALLGLGVLTLAIPHAIGQVAVVTDDTYVSPAQPDTAFGAASPIYVGGVSSNQAGNAYFNFQLATLPAGLVSSGVSKATLVFYVNSAMYGANPCSNICQLTISQISPTSAWNESTITFNTQPTGFVNPVTINVSAAAQFYTADVTSIVQGWLNDPSTNFGLAISGPGSAPENM